MKIDRTIYEITMIGSLDPRKSIRQVSLSCSEYTNDMSFLLDLYKWSFTLSRLYFERICLLKGLFNEARGST